MASNQTTNYGLNQWEATDQVLRTEFNADNSKIDAALQKLADKGGILQLAINLKGNCQMELLTYTGNSFPSFQIHFAQKPVWFMVFGTDGLLLGNSRTNTIVAIYYDTSMEKTLVKSSGITWSGNSASLTIWSGTTSIFNRYDTVYEVFSFYQSDAE